MNSFVCVGGGSLFLCGNQVALRVLQGGGQLAELVGAEVAVAVGQVAGYIGDEGLHRAQQGVPLGKGEVAAAYLRLAGLHHLG